MHSKKSQQTEKYQEVIGLHPGSCHPDSTWPEREWPWSNTIVSLVSSLAATWAKNSKPQDPELVNRRGEQSGDLSSWVLLDSPVLAVPVGPALSLSQPGCDKPQCWSHLCKPTKFPAPPPPTQLPSATPANLFILFLFSSLSLSLGSHLLCYLSPTLAGWSSELCRWSVVTHLLFKVFWVCYFSATLPRTTQSQNREERKWGRADGRGWGRNPKLLWKNSAEVPWSKLGLREQGHSKSNNGKETVLWLKLHWEGCTHTPYCSHNRDGVVRNPKESSLLSGNIYELTHPNCVDLAPARWKGAAGDSQSPPAKYNPNHLPETSVSHSPISMCLWLNYLDLLCGQYPVWSCCCPE